ncbi:hypothetical protein [Streptomyces sp. WAC01526]|uniref:hypothetical protein n=1 Tax=Streptomyces sp. WAC01526 TaxID=2588709 RepID=UPI0011E0319F|nr:hypothetical protein [Streptomyces sp. WAC01526]
MVIVVDMADRLLHELLDPLLFAGVLGLFSYLDAALVQEPQYLRRERHPLLPGAGPLLDKGPPHLGADRGWTAVELQPETRLTQ